MQTFKRFVTTTPLQCQEKKSKWKLFVVKISSLTFSSFSYSVYTRKLWSWKIWIFVNIVKCSMNLFLTQSQPDEDYKFILNYQDHFSKFCVFRPLKHKSACSVDKVHIFSLMGPPATLQSDNGFKLYDQFCNSRYHKSMN